jgi:hypothetical protein
VAAGIKGDVGTCSAAGGILDTGHLLLDRLRPYYDSCVLYF